MRRAFASALAAGLLAAGAAAPATAATPRPIVYAIVIDGLDGDRVDAGIAPTISGLLRGEGGNGTYYRESRAQIIAETNPNHTSMMTGAYIDKSGIPGNGFAVYAPLKANSCEQTGPLDPSKPPTKTSGESASCLVAQTVFEAVRRQRNPDRLVTAALLGKPKLGSIFNGRFFDGKAHDAHYLWSPCSSSLDGDEDYCDPDAARNQGTGYALTDGVVMDAVLRTVRDGVPAPGGGRRRPDFTFVNLPQVDSAGHAFGVGSVYDEAIGMADNEIRRLVDELRARGEWSRTVLILLSDHSMDTTPQKTGLADALEAGGVPASDFVVLGNGSAGMAYLTNRRRADRARVLKQMRAAALANPNVAEALYRQPNPSDGGSAHTIARVHPAWHAAGERTGDLLVLHRPGGAFSDPGETSNALTDVGPLFIGQHGASQTRDNFFAVVSGGGFLRLRDLGGTRAPDFDDTEQNPDQAENVDVASTVMGLFGLFEPDDDAGRFLDEPFTLSALPGRGRPTNRPRLRIRRLTKKRRRRGCKPRRVRYRLRWTPAGGRYDLQARRKGRKPYKRLVRNRIRTSRVFIGRRGRRYRIRVRMRSAAGVPSRWTYRRLRVPCRR